MGNQKGQKFEEIHMMADPDQTAAKGDHVIQPALFKYTTRLSDSQIDVQILG